MSTRFSGDTLVSSTAALGFPIALASVAFVLVFAKRRFDHSAYRQGYKIGVARRNRRSFEVLQPHYDSDDANCCPSSFRMRRFTWTGSHFKRGKAKKLETAPRRFYKR